MEQPITDTPNAPDAEATEPQWSGNLVITPAMVQQILDANDLADANEE